ncbi:MAG: branched-chain amino acid ABC transporter permease [Deltaproteobacteria bacterium]|jgi:branched-chain amino acid transport system permease protein|nr:branched-chain amino acid ABC transporter permease [Deltaproteobacteria bacterium]
MLYWQVLINGVLLGGLYACAAIGFSVIWGVMNLINLAHGSMIILGAYITYVINSATGLDPFLTIPISGAALFLLGFMVQKYLINHVIEGSVFMTLILTFGLDLLLVNMTLLLFTADFRSITPSYAGLAWEIGTIRVPYTRLGVFFFALALTLILSLLMNRTKLGNAIKATSFDKDAAGLVGVNVFQVYAITFGLGAAMAGMAGSLISVLHSFSPVLGGTFTMKAFVIVVLGGLGSVPGAIVGGLILGITENFASVLLEAGYKDAISFILLVAILVLRPRGILGKQFYAEVKE